MSPLRPRTPLRVHERLQNLVTAYHDSKIDYFPIVAGEHDPDDVLSNVMDVSLDRCDHHGPLLVCA